MVRASVESSASFLVEELEGVRLSGRQQVGNSGHADVPASARPKSSSRRTMSSSPK